MDSDGGRSEGHSSARHQQIALINKSDSTAIYIEAGSRSPTDLITCSDIDMMSSSTDGPFVHNDGMPYPDG